MQLHATSITNSRRIECIYVDREKKSGAATPAAAAVAGSISGANGNSGGNGGNGGGASGGRPGVGEQVRRRMLHSWAHPEEEHRPMLLFPEGTTSSGARLLPFKTGAFLAGLPVQPVILKYARVSGGLVELFV